jgi:hypothetical protein
MVRDLSSALVKFRNSLADLSDAVETRSTTCASKERALSVELFGNLERSKNHVNPWGPLPPGSSQRAHFAAKTGQSMEHLLGRQRANRVHSGCQPCHKSHYQTPLGAVVRDRIESSQVRNVAAVLMSEGNHHQPIVSIGHTSAQISPRHSYAKFKGHVKTRQIGIPFSFTSR